MPKLPMGDIGPCEVVWDYGGTPVNLSPFLGRVSLTGEDSVSKVFEETYGDAAVDGVFSGSVLALQIPMTRSTLAQLETALPGTDLNGGGTILTLSNLCGGAMYENAKAIVIKPIVNRVASTDHSKWSHIYKAHPMRAFELGFDRSGQRTFVVKFMVFPSLESGQEGKFGTLGVA